jgi:CO/xanthine dehydrogenase FAD-binding subunit
MKSFEFVRVDTTDAALELLAKEGPEARLIAGGQSLVPLLRKRQLQVKYLVDISRVPELQGIEVNGGLHIGAATRYRDLVRQNGTGPAALLAFCAGSITDRQVRNLATIGGSLCFGAPQYDMPPAAVTLSAVMVAKKADGSTREIPAGEFLVGARKTALDEDEMLVRVDVPGFEKGAAWSVQKFHPHQGQYALAWLGCVVSLDSATSACRQVRIVAGCAAETPVLCSRASGLLEGQSPTTEAAHEAAESVVDEVEPFADLVWASIAYKKELLRTLTYRCVMDARDRALKEVG